MAHIISINISTTRGERKRPAGQVRLRAGHGIVGDGHAGGWHRQVSLLALESIEKMRDRGLAVGPGDFAENFTTQGIDLPALPLGTRLRLGPALVRVTQIGKECHDRCEIFRQAGDCVMPREGIFAEVLEGGAVRDGDSIQVLDASVGEPDAASVPGSTCGMAETDPGMET
ncbi:MAG: MOSC domain-containing protein [Thermoleophilia bacterium]